MDYLVMDHSQTLLWSSSWCDGHFSPRLAASSSFPYLKKRIQVVEQQSTEMNPIEVAIDEMSRKVSELNQLCNMEEVDMIRLQLKLQGSVSAKVRNNLTAQKIPPGLKRIPVVCLFVSRCCFLFLFIQVGAPSISQVNAGPMAYARAFLEEKNAKKYPDNQVKLLKEIFR